MEQFKIAKRPSITFITYFINNKFIENTETLANMLKGCEFLGILYENGEIGEYIYDHENNLVHLTLGNHELFESYLSIDTLFGNLWKYKLFIKTKEKIEKGEIIKKEKVTNWPKIITDLEKLDIVKTFPTKSYLCVDTRRFYLKNENEENSYDVDFLGTTYAIDLSNKILDIWQRAKGFKVLSKSF